MKRDDFLLEIRTEEIPAAALAGARGDLARGIAEALAEAALAPAEVQSFATPRRLVVWAKEVPERQSDRDEEVLGPPAAVAFDAAGKPTKAAEGFARAQKSDVSALLVVDSPRGRTVAVRRTVPGGRRAARWRQSLRHLLPGLPARRRGQWRGTPRRTGSPGRAGEALQSSLSIVPCSFVWQS